MVGVGPNPAVGRVVSVGAGVGAKPTAPDPLAWSADLFFSMAGLTNSVASALSDVDLDSSVHSYTTPRRLSIQGNPTGECSRGRRNWKRPWCWCGLPSSQEASGGTVGKAWVLESVISGGHFSSPGLGFPFHEMVVMRAACWTVCFGRCLLRTCVCQVLG